jgi:hypothetical protein
VSSSALQNWETARRSRINELLSAHAAVGGTGPGRRTATQQLNWALTLSLAAEFQGFVRDLHDEASDVLTSRSYVLSPALGSVWANLLTLNRQLSTKNATASTLQQDFARFGFKVLDEVKVRYRRGDKWLKALESMNAARNAIAHSNHDQIAATSGGTPISLTKVKSWYGVLRNLSKAIDRITADNLAVLTNGDHPW